MLRLSFAGRDMSPIQYLPTPIHPEPHAYIHAHSIEHLAEPAQQSRTMLLVASLYIFPSFSFFCQSGICPISIPNNKSKRISPSIVRPIQNYPKS
jgi:hypothetical protein